MTTTDLAGEIGEQLLKFIRGEAIAVRHVL